MTITFQGHVEALEAAAPSQVVVKLRTPIEPAGGHQMTLRLPAPNDEAQPTRRP
jgi:hypothetical protein